jgi:hypothetical protein
MMRRDPVHDRVPCQFISELCHHPSRAGACYDGWPVEIAFGVFTQLLCLTLLFSGFGFNGLLLDLRGW